MKSLILFSVLSLIAVVLSANDPQYCFDVLQVTPNSEIKKYSEMSFKETANTSFAEYIFSCFLEESRYTGGEKSDIERHYDLYKKCNEYAKYTDEAIGYRQLNELMELGLQQVFVDYLQKAIQSKNNIKQSILFIADQLQKSIEDSFEFKNYKKFILQHLEKVKIQNSRNSGQTSYFIEISYIMNIEFSEIIRKQVTVVNSAMPSP